MTPQKIGTLAEERLRQLIALYVEASRSTNLSEYTVLGAATVAEGYIGSTLGALIAASGYDGTAFGRAMYAELEDRIHQSWSERHSWLNRAFSVNIIGTTACQDLLILVELRNALVHGGGRLTYRQSREIGGLIGLEKQLHSRLGVQADGRTLTLLPQTAVRAVEIARAYILTLDAEIRQQHPDLPV